MKIEDPLCQRYSCLQVENINRNISEKLRIKIDTEIRSIADNYLNVHSRLWRQPTADGTTYLHDTHDTYPENE